MKNNHHEPRPLRRLLAFDTSTSSLAVAVMEDGRLLAEKNIHAERNHSAYLVSAIGEALSAAGIAKSELDGIAVGVGPGSYTGARIAVTTAKTLAWSLGLPVYGVSSLEALALGGFARGSGFDPAALGAAAASVTAGVAGTSAEEAGVGNAVHWIVPLVDARRGQAYTALFAAEAGRMPERMEPDAIRLTADWTAELAVLLDGLEPKDRPAGLWFVGETALHASVAETLRPLMGDALHLVPYELEGIAAGLAGIRRTRLRGGDDVHAIEPNYTQLAEAEAKRLRGR